MRQLILLIVLSYFALALCSCVKYVETSGNDAKGCGSQTEPCQTISQGINEAKGEHSCIIELGRGSYNATDGGNPIKISNMSLGIFATSALYTVINGGDPETSGFHIHSEDAIVVSFTGLTMTGFVSTTSNGGAISVTGDASLQLASCIFRSNKVLGTGAFGGAIFHNSTGSFGARNTQFDYNTASSSGFGGAVAVVDKNSYVDILACAFNENTAAFGGALYSSVKSLFIQGEGSLFKTNMAHQGGGLYASLVHDGAYYISNVTFAHNAAQPPFYPGDTFYDGGAVYFKSDQDTKKLKGRVTGCVFDTNVAFHSAGAVFFSLSQGGAPIFSDCVFLENRCGQDGTAHTLHFESTGNPLKQEKVIFSESQIRDSLSDGGVVVFCNNTNVDLDTSEINLLDDATESYKCNNCNTCLPSTCSKCSDCNGAFCADASNGSCECFSRQFDFSSSSSSSSTEASQTSSATSSATSSTPENTSSSSTTPDTSDTGSSDTHKSGNSKGLAIGLGVAIGIIVVVIAAAAFFFYKRHRASQAERTALLDNGVEDL